MEGWERASRIAVAELLRAADAALDAADGWVFTRRKNGVEEHRKAGDRAVRTVRGRGFVPGADARRFVALITDLGPGRRAWDPVFRTGVVARRVSEGISIVWMELQTKKCVLEFHRDLLYMQTVCETDGCFVVASRSDPALVDPDLVAVPPGAIRATLLTSGYVVRPVAGGCEVTFVVQIDLGGPVPVVVINRIQKDMPQCIVRQTQAYRDRYAGSAVDEDDGGGGGVELDDDVVEELERMLDPGAPTSPAPTGAPPPQPAAAPPTSPGRGSDGATRRNNAPPSALFDLSSSTSYRDQDSVEVVSRQRRDARTLGARGAGPGSHASIAMGFPDISGVSVYSGVSVASRLSEATDNSGASQKDVPMESVFDESLAALLQEPDEWE